MVANIVLNWKLLDGVGPQEMSAGVNTLTGNQSDTTYQDGIESHSYNVKNHGKDGLEFVDYKR